MPLKGDCWDLDRKKVNEMAAENGRLKEEARRYYHADGTFVILDSPEEVVRRRIDAAERIAALEADRNRLASFLDLKVTIRDRETLARIRRADLIRVLTARGWTKRSEWVDDVEGVYAEVWEKPGVEWPRAIVPADNAADREAKVSETIGDIARAESIGALWVLAELLANPPAGPPAAGMPDSREETLTP